MTQFTHKEMTAVTEHVVDSIMDDAIVQVASIRYANARMGREYIEGTEDGDWIACQFGFYRALALNIMERQLGSDTCSWVDGIGYPNEVSTRKGI